MEEPKEKGVSVCRISESSGCVNEKVAGETLEESAGCPNEGQDQIEGCFSGELVTEEDDGGCNGKDVMVEVLGSDLYIDGVCTRRSAAELNDEVGCDGSVEVKVGLDKHVKPLGSVTGVYNGAEAGFMSSQVVQSSEYKSKNVTNQLDCAVVDRNEVSTGTSEDHNAERDREVVGSDEIELVTTQEELGTSVSDPSAVVDTKPGETEVPDEENVGLKHVDSEEAGVPDDKVATTRSGDAFGVLSAGISMVEENSEPRLVEEDQKKVRNLTDDGAMEIDYDVTLKSFDEHEKIANLGSEAFLQDRVESVQTSKVDEKSSPVEEQPMGIDKVGETDSSLLTEVVAGAEIALDKVPLNCEERNCSKVEKCIDDKKRIADISGANSDTGQGMEIDKHFHAEGSLSHGKGQNSENYEIVGASTKRDLQVCNVGPISSVDCEGTLHLNHEVLGYALNEQQQKTEECIEKGTVAVQVSLLKRQDMEIEDQPERIQIVSQTDFIPVTSVSCSMGEQNLETNAFSGSVEDGIQIADRVHFAPVGAEGFLKFNDDKPFSADDQKSKWIECASHSVQSNIKHSIEGQAGISEQVGSQGRQETQVEELGDAEPRKTDDSVTKNTIMKPGSSGRLCYAGYELPPEKEGDFSVSDMVWGKVRSHPWWPGQIFDPSDSSEKAMKHYKKDCFLVAYFGDRTFAWNEASQLKHFRTHFSNIEKQSNSESFHNAVDCALDEVSRRVEFELACSCTPKDIYDEIKFQTVENTGIREESSLRHGLDESLNVSYFSPDRLLHYLKSLAKFPSGGIDRLELVIAEAQLLAFYRLKGYPCLPEFQYCGGLDNDMNTLLHDTGMSLSEVFEHEYPARKDDDQASDGPGILKSQNSSRHKRKHNLKDGMYPKKEKSLSKLMGGAPDDDYWSDEANDNLGSPMFSKKRRTSDPFADDFTKQDGRKTISLAKVSNTLPKPSFKFGERIRRVASQLTGSPIILKSSSEKSQKPDGSTDGFAVEGSGTSFQNLEETQRSSLVVPPEYSSLDDLLSSLQWMAQHPLGDYSSSKVILSFFSDFRNSISVGPPAREITPTNKVGNKRRKLPIAGSPETFEFEDMSDTYWTDRVIQNGSEEQPPRRNRKRDNQLVPADPEKSLQVSRRSYSKKRVSDGNHTEAPEKPSISIDEKAPAELVMNFAELDSVPSEINLNKMFRRFGPLKESETEVDRVSSRARVVFKKSADAEVAFSSAKKFNIFGQVLVNYQLNYTPSALFKASSVAAQDQEMHLDLSNFEVNMSESLG